MYDLLLPDSVATRIAVLKTEAAHFHVDEKQYCQDDDADPHHCNQVKLWVFKNGAWVKLVLAYVRILHNHHHYYTKHRQGDGDPRQFSFYSFAALSTTGLLRFLMELPRGID